MSKDTNKRSGKQNQKRRPKDKGIVMSVPSGDRIIVYSLSEAQASSSARWTPPPKKEIKLSWIQAPRNSASWFENDKKKSREADPFFWKSREFLRNKCIGKVVEFDTFSKPDDKDKDNKGKDNKDNKRKKKRDIPRFLGNVSLKDGANEKIDLSSLIVTAGWATVRVPEKVQERMPDRLQKLMALENEAKTQLLGVHNEAEAAKNKQDQLRKFDQWAKFKTWRNQKMSGVVESVISGSLLIVTLFPKLETIRVKISGVRSPNLRDKEIFAKEAQFTTERYTLHRNVEVILTSFDRDRKDEDSDEEPKTGVFHGEVFLNLNSIGELLLQSGLAQYVDWSAPEDKKEKYKQLEKTAQAAKTRMWSVQANLVKASMAAAAASVTGGSFMGRVRGVTSGSTLAVENNDKPENITLSSIRVPKLGRENAPHEALAWNAREFVRKKLIGKVVRVTLDYIIPERTVNKKVLPAKKYYTVEHDNRNIALALVENGLATVLERGGDKKSPHYNDFIMAQDKARTKGLGLHGRQDSLKPRLISDISRDAKKSKARYQSLAKPTTHKAIVEYVIAGHRFKLTLPNENVVIGFNLSGARCNSVPSKPKKGEEPKEIPPFAIEARDFARNTVHNYDVEILIDGQDKSGAFKGYMWRRKKNVAELLLKEGLARTTRSKKYSSEFETAERAAKKARKGLWASYTPVADKPKDEEVKPVKALVEVTEVMDANFFYVQVLGGEEKAKLDSFMAGIAKLPLASQPPFTPNRGETVLAQFSGDNVWYRAKAIGVNASNGNVKVLYGDFGNTEITTPAKIRKLPAQFGTEALRFQARQCSLAFITPRTLKQEWGTQAAEELRKLVWGKQLLACIEYTIQSTLFLSLWDEERTYINGELVKEGLARVESRPRRGAPRELITHLRKQEDIAHDDHKGVWIHGDPGSSEEET
eukprot:TRINITY_DN8538_c0_g1_i1.p1 TRINITY_DN8538_c0_g1~~TRINITY_DN8538_c0_g1_i1.p1  ORF type:complete len:929 (-),score=214.38 TRINITY_DN8538_c0_g1_i1:125-2911(-)